MKSLEYLDLAESRLGLTDYAMAKRLAITRGYISSIRTGRHVMSDQLAMKIAKMAEVPAAKVLVSAQVDRATDPEEAAAWTAILEKISVGFNAFISPRNPRHVRI